MINHWLQNSDYLTANTCQRLMVFQQRINYSLERAKFHKGKGIECQWCQLLCFDILKKNNVYRTWEPGACNEIDALSFIPCILSKPNYNTKYSNYDMVKSVLMVDVIQHLTMITLHCKIHHHNLKFSDTYALLSIWQLFEPAGYAWLTCVMLGG